MLGASAVGAAVIAVLVAAVVLVTGGDEPTEAPLNFVDPSFSATPSANVGPDDHLDHHEHRQVVHHRDRRAARTDDHLRLVEHQLQLQPSTSSSSSSSSEPSPPPGQSEEEEGPTIRTPRRPRTNITRTLLPLPIG